MPEYETLDQEINSSEFQELLNSDNLIVGYSPITYLDTTGMTIEDYGR